MLYKLAIIIIVVLEQLNFSPSLIKDTETRLQRMGILPKEKIILSAKNLTVPKNEIDDLPKVFPQDINMGDKEDPDIFAKQAVVVDYDTSAILFDRDAETSIPMASTTKIMTAVVVLENAELDEEVTVSNNAVATRGNGSGLRPGEKITVKSLLYCLLLPSSNDAATALAEHISGSVEEFVKLMNDKAKELGLRDTNFKNPSGLDEDNHRSSSRDLAILTAYALKNELFASIIATRDASVSSSDGRIIHGLKNSNKLLADSELNVSGVKTGFTDNAGECLVALASNGKHKIIIVVLGSENRFGETKDLINWAFRNYRWER